MKPSEFVRHVGIIAGLSIPSASGQGLYYNLETIASHGSVTSAGETIKEFHQSSVNESGIVAFIADGENATTTVRRVYISGTSGTPVALGSAGDNRSTSNARINAAGKIVAHENYYAGTPRPSLIRVWDALQPGLTPPPLVSNLTSALSIVLAPPSIANDGVVLFPGLLSSPPRRLYMNTTGGSDQRTDVGSIITGSQPWLASGQRYVLREGQTTAGSLSVKLGPAAARQTLASMAGGAWTRIGNLPGISDSGTVVAFVAEHPMDGQGLYLWIDEGSDPQFDEPVKILGFPEGADGLGITDDNNYIVFGNFNFENRVAVEHREAGPPGIEGDSILVSFIATPDRASFTNDRTGEPMLFTEEPALWVVHLTPGRNLSGTGPLTLENKTSPLPVVQVGDRIDGEFVTGISTYDPLAFAVNTPAGLERVTVGPADHYVTCQISTAGGGKILRASQFDSDFDGLFDHWEEIGGGVDVDRDGAPDLVLSDFGANPYRKDLFIEIDWSPEWRPETYTDVNGNGKYDSGEPFEEADGNGEFTISDYAPDPIALQQLADRFANAPVANPVGPPGISVHIDAGPSRSVNLPGTAAQGGGDLVVEPGTGNFIHVVFGDEAIYEFQPPGTTDDYGNPLVEVSSQALRREYSGQADKNARELAFRYVVFANTIGAVEAKDTLGLSESPFFSLRETADAESFTDLNGNGKWFAGEPFRDLNSNGFYDSGEPFFDMTGSDGKGNPPNGIYDPPEPFSDTNGNGIRDGEKHESYRSMPGNSIILGLSGTRAELTEDGRLRVALPNGGAPADVAVPPGFFHYQVLYHELGHALTLNHGGNDVVTGLGPLTPKPEYRSIMNYGYVEFTDRNGVLIRDYSSDSATYDDWSNVRMDLCRYFDGLGGHYSVVRYDAGEDAHVDSGVRTIELLENFHGPLGPSNRAPSNFISPGNADHSDNDNDGFVLLVEEAFGMNPNVPDADRYPVTAAIVGQGEGAVYQINFPRDTSLGIGFEVQRSADLTEWTADGIAESFVNTQGTVKNVIATYPVITPGKLYFRLKLTRDP